MLYHEADKTKKWIKTQSLNLSIDVLRKQPIIHYNKVFVSAFLSNSKNFYNQLSIKLTERNETKPVEWRIEYENNLLEEVE